MAYAKYKELVDALDQKTRDGKVDWKQSPTEGVFHAAFPGYSIKISRHETDFGAYDIKIAIFDESGQVIEEFFDGEVSEFDTDNRSYYKVMLALYDIARRVALGSDKALDTIINSLRQMR